MMPTASSDILEERLDFRARSEDAERLRALAREEQTSVGAIIRRAVLRFLREQEAERHERGEARK